MEVYQTIVKSMVMRMVWNLGDKSDERTTEVVKMDVLRSAKKSQFDRI